MMAYEKQSRAVRDEAEWRFVRQLSGHAKHDERVSLMRWLSRAPEHARAYDATNRLWDDLGQLRDDPDIEAMQAEAEDIARQSRRQASARQSPTRARRWTAAALAAGLAALALGGVIRYAVPLGEHTEGTVLTTSASERRSETLPDGSTVTLNVATRAEARLGEVSRRIVFDNGEAAFSVAHDPQRPFVVEVGADTRITALGTRFQVRHDPESTRVTLLEGSIRIDRANAERVLKVGEQATLPANGGIEVSSVDLREATSWSRGWMVFRGQSLRYVVDEVNRYAERPIRIADPSLAELSLSGNFYLGDSASMAAAMAVVLPIDVRTTDEAFVLQPLGAPRVPQGNISEHRG